MGTSIAPIWSPINESTYSSIGHQLLLSSPYTFWFSPPWTNRYHLPIKTPSCSPPPHLDLTFPLHLYTSTPIILFGLLIGLSLGFSFHSLSRESSPPPHQDYLSALHLPITSLLLFYSLPSLLSSTPILSSLFNLHKDASSGSHFFRIVSIQPKYTALHARDYEIFLY